MGAWPADASDPADRDQPAISSPRQGTSGYAFADYLRRFGAVTVFTLISGAFMVVGGYLFHTHGWHIGGLLMLPSGPAISAAFALLLRAERSRNGLPQAGSAGTARRVRAAVTIAAGLPWTGGNAPIGFEIGTFGLTMAAGAVMALSGYAAVWTWLLVPPIVVLAGVLITAAFAVATKGFRHSGSRRSDLGAY